MKFLFASSLACIALFGATNAIAGEPFSPSSGHFQRVQYSNDPERIYEESTIEGLRQRCTAKQFPRMDDRDEIRDIANGYVVHRVGAGSNGVPVYMTYSFNNDKRQFVSMKGQRLRKDNRLGLKLALPRDYARCRIVSDGVGGEFLEVVSIDRTSHAAARDMQKMAKDLDLRMSELIAAGGPGAPGGPVCPPSAASQAERIIVQGSVVQAPVCVDSVANLKSRMTKLLISTIEN